jgi:hypothetical protein
MVTVADNELAFEEICRWATAGSCAGGYICAAAKNRPTGPEVEIDASITATVIPDPDSPVTSQLLALEFDTIRAPRLATSQAPRLCAPAWIAPSELFRQRQTITLGAQALAASNPYGKVRMTPEDRPLRYHSERELFELIRGQEEHKLFREKEWKEFEEANSFAFRRGEQWVWESEEYKGYKAIVGNMERDIKAARDELAARREDRKRGGSNPD